MTSQPPHQLLAVPHGTTGSARGTAMTSTEPRRSRLSAWASAAAEDARAMRAQAVRDCAALQQENEQRLADSRERLRRTAELLLELARERR